jgi:hypothetical protein
VLMKRASSALNKERPMKARQRIGMATALVAFFAVMGMAQPEEGPLSLVDPATVPLEPATGENIWANYKCLHSNTCPSGTLRSLDFSYSGCTKDPVLEKCIGSCKQCTGSLTNDGYICKPKNGDNCEFQTLPGTAIPCGKTNTADCYYSATTPGGEPQATPNGCYCRTAWTATQNNCSVTSCINTGG